MLLARFEGSIGMMLLLSGLQIGQPVSRPGSYFEAGQRPWTTLGDRQTSFGPGCHRLGVMGHMATRNRTARVFASGLLTGTRHTVAQIGQQAGWLPGQGSLGAGTAAIGPVVAGRWAQTPSACIPRPRLPNTTPNCLPWLPRQPRGRRLMRPPGPCAATSVWSNDAIPSARGWPALREIHDAAFGHLRPARRIPPWPGSGRDRYRNRSPGRRPLVGWSQRW
jgi:hypothetical protein